MRKKYDIGFVLPSFSYNYPPGGYNIVYQSASFFSKNGKSVIIITPKGNKEYLNHFYDSLPKGLKGKLFSLMLPVLETKLFQKYLLPLIRKIRKIDFDFTILDGVDQSSQKNPKKIRFEIEKIIASSWETTYYINEFLKTHKSKAYYLIQHDESSADYSGRFATLASKSYEFNYVKIVTNKPLLNLFENEKVYYVPLGIDKIYHNPVEHIIETKENNSILIQFGIGISKGFEYGIRAIDNIHKKFPDVKIYAFGNADARIIPRYIHFFYRPSIEQLVDLYLKSDIFILPSLIEGVSLVAMEAMALGCSCILTNCGGINDYAQQGYNAIIVPIKDSLSISDSYFHLVQNVQLKNRLKINGMKTIKKYTYDNMGEKFLKILEED
jgi:glycosyltransferase involved in cell wall biosynthesis